MLAGLTVCERKRGIEIMKVQEAVAVYGVETVSTKDLLACIIGDKKKAANICDNNNEVFKMLNRTGNTMGIPLLDHIIIGDGTLCLK